MATDAVQDVWDDWQDAVTMTAKELEDWIETDESKSVGDSSGGESTGHRSGRRIVEILRTTKDVEHSDWRYSLMNWGHDPLT